jgi:transcriptional regulator with XRE-family HTH domain
MSLTEQNRSTDASNTDSSFSDRLKTLVGEGSVSAFARKVGLSESLIRKYMKGSEPSLARADQIARQVNVSLEWLATGCGYMYRQAEVVDLPGLELANALVTELAPSSFSQIERLTVVVSVYQYLRAHKKPDGYLDEFAGRQFAAHLIEGQG